ncbi:MAG: EamA family transporter, partial [Actinomycetota bacterium]|nr:EamA family transporter [Actinomycetota bacterium]
CATLQPMAGAGRSPDALTLGAFAVAVTLGGANFLAVRFSNRELPPFWGAGLRFALAALAFVVIALALRLRWPRGRQLTLTALYGSLSFAISYALLYWALLQVTAGVAAVVLAVVPLATLLLAAAQRLERLGPRGAMGALLALAGIVWMTVGPQRVVVPLSALAAMLAAAVCIGQSIILGKRLSANHPAMTNAVGMTAGALLLLVISAAAGDSWALPRQAEAAWAVAYLVTLGSVGLFVLVLLVVRRWTASATSYMFVLFPVVTMALGAALADEPVTGQAVTGAALVMLGVWLGALSPGARRLAAPLPAQAPPPAPEAP